MGRSVCWLGGGAAKRAERGQRKGWSEKQQGESRVVGEKRLERPARYSVLAAVPAECLVLVVKAVFCFEGEKMSKARDRVTAKSCGGAYQVPE